MNTFGARSALTVGGQQYEIFRLDALQDQYNIARLPYSLRVLLENLLRTENPTSVPAADIEALAQWDPTATPSAEIAFTPARVLLQDFTGVPAVVDLAAMRDAMRAMGGDPAKINPLQPVEMVVDHSVQVDVAGAADAIARNTDFEFQRNGERYEFLRWGQGAFNNFRVVPPATGIVHQVNLEFLARVVMPSTASGTLQAYPDTLVGTDSHTTMINGIGVLGWGVGGIEAEAAMLGQPVSMLIPQVVGFELIGSLPEGATATDLVLTVVQMLRAHGVVGKFVEYFGAGLAALPLADRATIANMAPEYGATCGFFPVGVETLKYLRLSGRSEEQVALVEAYTKEQGLFYEAGSPTPEYSATLALDLSTVEPCISGPKRPEGRIALGDAKAAFAEVLTDMRDGQAAHTNGETIGDGSVVIAAITSCTNTSNPAVLVAAGLVAQKARARGLNTKPWVKTSLAPGSQVVPAYLEKAGLLSSLNELGFNVVGFGCTTCIGNSGPLAAEVETAIKEQDLVVAAVLSGNRNFEGRIHALIKTNYLASPPLVVAYALAGSMNVDLVTEPLGTDTDGQPVYLRDVWPTQQEVQEAVQAAVSADMFREKYGDVYTGNPRWNAIPAPEGDLYRWSPDSTYVRHPPYFEGMGPEPDAVRDITGARVLALLGDSITTDHISPAGAIGADTPAGAYLLERGVKAQDFNSLGSRRGNHEVMMRGTFANVRLRNQLAPGTEGGWTQHLPDGEQMSIFDAAAKYREAGTPLLVIAGGLYGNGSSRDWAAKGPMLLGVRAVLATSYERIHRSNLVGMGILPLEFKAAESAESLGLTGRETYDITGIGDGSANEVTVTATADDGGTKTFQATVRIDTPQEVLYYQHGGILQYVLRQLLR